MLIKSITIEGVEADIEITRIHSGALVTQGSTVLCEMRRDDDNETRRLKAIEVAKAVYGVAKTSRFGPGGGPNATGSMVYDVRCRIEEIAGC